MFLEVLVAVLVALAVAMLIVMHSIDWLSDKKYTLYKVTSNEGEGIPFFVKKRVYYHETTYRQPLAEVSLVVTRIEPDVPPTVDHAATRIVKWSDPAYTILQAIWQLGQVVNHEDKESAKTEFQKLTKHIYQGEVPPDKEAYLASNRVRDVVVVDYAKGHYINIEQSLLASSQLTVKLASDGTFSEGAGSVDLAPLSELLALPGKVFEGMGAKLVEGVVKKPAVTTAATAATLETYRIEVTVRPFFLMHVLSEPTNNHVPGPRLKLEDARNGGNGRYNYHTVVTELGAEPPPEAIAGGSNGQEEHGEGRPGNRESGGTATANPTT